MEYFLGQGDLAKSKSNTSYNLVFDRVGFYTNIWISTFSSRSKSSPENETKLCLFRFAPSVESSTHFFSLMPIDPCKNWRKNKQRYSHFAFDNPRHVYGFLLHETRDARGNIIRVNSIPSKNNLRGIRMGIGPISGINSLTPLSSLANI